jgi:hypothetical protein
MPRPLSHEAKTAMKARDLQRRLDSYEAAAAVMPLSYLEALSALAHIAINGLRRPDDLGGTITGRKAASTGCRELHPASRELDRDIERLQVEAERLDALLERYDPDVAGEGDGTSQSIGAA